MFNREDLVPPEQRLLTTRDVSELLGVSESAVRSMTGDGRLVSVKFGQAVRFRRQDIEAFIRSAAGDEERDEPEVEVATPPQQWLVAAGEERVEISAESFEVMSEGTLVFRSSDGGFVALFPPDEWRWMRRIDV
jgi:excisionase family DNA binding protein